jgi:hypothetical protein
VTVVVIVVPFFDEKEVKLLRVLTDRGTEYCGNPEHHEYELVATLSPRARSRLAAAVRPARAQELVYISRDTAN